MKFLANLGVALTLGFPVLTAAYLKYKLAEDVKGDPKNTHILRSDFDDSDNEDPIPEVAPGTSADAVPIGELAQAVPGVSDQSSPLVDVVPDSRAGRKLARRIGETVRFQLGCPRATQANRIIAIQRCQAELDIQCPHLRHNIKRLVLMRAVEHVLIPSLDELEMADTVNCREAIIRSRRATMTHATPRFGSRWIANVLLLFGFQGYVLPQGFPTA